MKLITRQSTANDVATRWAHQYANGKYGQDKVDILNRLYELGDNPNPDDVDKVIGNKSWTKTECNQCGAKNVDVVEVGQEPDYESYTADICKPCLVKALALFD